MMSVTVTVTAGEKRTFSLTSAAVVFLEILGGMKFFRHLSNIKVHSRLEKLTHPQFS